MNLRVWRNRKLATMYDSSISLCLHGSTDNPAEAVTEPVARPEHGSAPLRWYRDTKPRFYRPYLIRVLDRDDTTIKFVFLDSYTGLDMTLSHPEYKIAYHDGRYAYSGLPSTAPRVQPGSARSCGLLFMSDLYLQTLSQRDQDAIAAVNHDDQKWPRAAGMAAPAVAAPEAPPRLDLGGVSLTEEDLRVLRRLLDRAGP